MLHLLQRSRSGFLERSFLCAKRGWYRNASNESIRFRLCPLPEAPRTRASEFEVLLSLARRVYDSVRPCPAAFVAYVQASQDLNVHPSQLRDWVKKLSEDPQHAFPGHGHLSNSAWFIGR
jgi:hypothetical protein